MLRSTIMPNRRYLTKMRLIMTIVLLLILAFTIPLLWLINRDAGPSSNTSTILYGGAVAINLLWYVPGLLLARPYFYSLKYEIQDDEAIVHAGIWTHSVKHVPYRTVTNLTIKRDLLDRWLFNIGSLHIQTAGMSGTTGAEEVLAGLSNVQEVYEDVVKELQRFRGGMTPTTTETEFERATDERDAVSAALTRNAILAELKAIRQILESG
jgi:uncharacterized membrane protein YdbT with pleckstrin-like domain